MKVRHGFVSNSSSSSFIIGHGDITKVAKEMLDILFCDDLDWPSDDVGNEWKHNMETAANLDRVKNGSIGITFPSCNYDTYIVKEGNKVYVSTCRNTDWSGVQDNAIDWGGGSDEGEDDECHKRVQEKDFFDLRDGTIHSSEKYYDGDFEKRPKCPTPDCRGGWSYFEKDGQQICS